MLMVAVATPAYSQGLNMNMLGGATRPKTQEEVDYEKARDKAYQSAIKKMPDQNAKSDPWGNIRGSGTPQNNQTQSRSGTR
jgi:hypothetical protein